MRSACSEPDTHVNYRPYVNRPRPWHVPARCASTLPIVTAPSRSDCSDRGLLLLFGAIVATALVAAIDAYSLSIWALEVAPIAIVLPLLWFSRTWMRFTPLLYGLIAAHSVSS